MVYKNNSADGTINLYVYFIVQINNEITCLEIKITCLERPNDLLRLQSS